MNPIPKLNRARIAFCHDLIMAGISLPFSLYLRVGELFGFYSGHYFIDMSLLFVAIAAPIFLYSNMYQGIWRYASVEDLAAITKAVTLAILIFVPVLFLLTRLEQVPRSLPIIQWFVLMALLGGPRFLYRIFKDRRLEYVLHRTDHRRVSVMLIGAGDAAELFIRQQNRDKDAPYQVTAIVDDKGGRIGRSIHGVPIIGRTEQLELLLQEKGRVKPQRIILTQTDLEGSEVRNILDVAERHGCSLSRLPRITKLESDLANKIETQPIAVDDLLGRPQKTLDRDAMQALIRHNNVLVTGSGGSIGSELVRQIIALKPTSITLFDSSEYQLYQINQEIAETFPDIPRYAVLGDVRDGTRIEQVFKRRQPQLVFHAAALKHVPMVEQNPMEGVLTNVIGTRNIADACARHNVEAMVLISTDKAVNPTSIMGATKRIAESYCQALDLYSQQDIGTRYVTVRFGNVLGSTGSVVPLFQRQLLAGGPLTVTHKDVTRYFMTTKEAVELVLQATALATSDTETTGRIHVLEMGQPVRIYDLAEQMIRLAGLQPLTDIDIEIIGLRPGEKLYEELLHDKEALLTTSNPSLLLAEARTGDLEPLRNAINQLAEFAHNRRSEDTLKLIQKLVPEYEPDATTKVTNS
tara:strand:- start:413 stop:2320 length:1908 start_codon:yes stop_codon:yes gene_type:complete